MESTFWRHWWWNGGYFGAIFYVKSLLPKPKVNLKHSSGGSALTDCDPQDKTAEVVNNLISGTVGGFVGTTLNTPCTPLTDTSMTLMSTDIRSS